MFWVQNVTWIDLGGFARKTWNLLLSHKSSNWIVYQNLKL